MNKTRPFEISKQIVMDAFQRVKANHGAAGVDQQSIEDFERNLKGNLYRIWNRMSSGTWFPPPVRAVPIPKKTGGTRLLGVPTVSDRIAQMVVKMYLEPGIEPFFHPDSYGYRPGKSAIQAIEITRKRCWRYDWVLEFDIVGLFDNIDHDLLMKAVDRHTDCKWIKLYIQRWLTAPFRAANGEITPRTSGTPQGGVISPLLANLFLHYAFDLWMSKHHSENPFARYADDAVTHCKTLKEAETLREALERRFGECNLKLHPEKTRIVYCQDSDRRGTYPITSFDFLGYTFRPRRSKNKWGKYFINFTPAMSNKAKKHCRQKTRGWQLQNRADKEISDISHMFNPVLRGWINYYGHFYKSEMYSVFRHFNHALIEWARRKYKKLARHKKRAERWLKGIAIREPKLFAHWHLLGLLPTAE